jgi:hypothetical protein
VEVESPQVCLVGIAVMDSAMVSGGPFIHKRDYVVEVQSGQIELAHLVGLIHHLGHFLQKFCAQWCIQLYQLVK